MKGLRGVTSVINNLLSTNGAAALSAAQGKVLAESIRDKGLPELTYFHNIRLFTPSTNTPYLRADIDHSNLSASVWPDLVPLLNGFNFISGATEVFTATPSIGSDPELILTNDADHIGAVRSLLEDVRFFNWNEAGNDIAAFDDTTFSNYSMCIEIVTSSVAGLVAGQKYRIKYVTSLANTLDVSARRIRIATTTTGSASSVTFRIKPFVRLSDANARWRRIDDAVIQSGFSGLRRLDQFQGFRFGVGATSVLANADSRMANGGNDVAFFATVPVSPATIVTDGINGTPRPGNKVRPRSGGAYLYILGGRCLA